MSSTLLRQTTLPSQQHFMDIQVARETETRLRNRCVNVGLHPLLLPVKSLNLAYSRVNKRVNKCVSG